MDFIEVYPDALDAATCADIIRRFEASGRAVRGATGSGVDTSLKDSWDLEISALADWRDAVDALQRAAFAGFCRYLRTYPYTLLAPLALKIKHPQTGEPVRLDPDTLAALPEATFHAIASGVFRPGSINVQKYLADQGGYPYWHCEHYPKAGSVEPLHRVLLYTIYLNDGFAEGETEFVHQRRRIAPATGALLLAPAFFTHTHRGNRPRGGDKYIATSWILFQPAERLFNAPQR